VICPEENHLMSWTLKKLPQRFTISDHLPTRHILMADIACVEQHCKSKAFVRLFCSHSYETSITMKQRTYIHVVNHEIPPKCFEPSLRVIGAQDIGDFSRGNPECSEHHSVSSSLYSDSLKAIKRWDDILWSKSVQKASYLFCRSNADCL
jgi:hypothetical protein